MMLSINSDQLRDNVFKVLQVLVLALGIFTVLVFGSTFFRFGIWNEYSILSLASGLIALAIPALGSIAMAKTRSKELAWQRLESRERILLKTAELQKLSEFWRESDSLIIVRPEPHDPRVDQLNKATENLLKDIREAIDDSIYLGDLDTVKECLGNIRSILQETHWLGYWIMISFDNSPKGWE